MSNQQLNAALELQAHHREESMMDVSSKTEKTVSNTLKATDKTVTYTKLNKEK